MASQPQPTIAIDVDAVRDRLDRVTDPELDESIVALEYVDRIAIDGGHVTVELRLPTAWCSPAFAWMMATDARDAVEALPGVEGATVRLLDHMHATEITEGVDERRSFGAVFPDADGDVTDVRRTLDEKARIARQYDAVEALLRAGLRPRQIVELRPSDLALSAPAAVFLHDRALGLPVPARPLERYLEKARETGLLDDGRPTMFRTPEGGPIPLEDFELVHRRGRLARVNQGGQGSVCAALNRARRRTSPPPPGDG